MAGFVARGLSDGQSLTAALVGFLSPTTQAHEITHIRSHKLAKEGTKAEFFLNSFSLQVKYTGVIYISQSQNSCKSAIIKCRVNLIA